MSLRRRLLTLSSGLVPLVVLAAILFGLDTPEPVYAVTRNVNILSDPNPDGSCSPSPGDCSLREAITAGNGSSGDVIQLQAGIYALTQTGADDINANGDLDIMAAMTIKGASNGATHISAAAVGERIFHVVPGGGPDFTVVLTGLTIEDGSEPSSGGGGVYNQDPNARLVINNSMITGNTAADGSAIFNHGELKLNGSRVVSNLNEEAATIYTEGGPTTISRSAIRNNPGDGVRGSGVFVVTSSTFSRNNDGLSVAGGESATFEHSTFSANRRHGLLVAAASVVVDGSTFNANGSNGITLEPTGDAACTASIRNTTISGNTGDGVNHEATAGCQFNVTANNTTIARNGGIGVLTVTPNATTTLSNTIVADNAGGDVFGNVPCVGSNIVKDGTCQAESGDPKLGPLAANGGPTRTHRLLPGSPALDQGFDCEIDDQRGVPRPQGAGCDLGAWEGMFCFGRPDTRIGTAGDDVMRGTEGADVFLGLGGGDTFRLLGGNDRACGGTGADRFDGGDGALDRCDGQQGPDTHLGGCETTLSIP